MIFGVLVIHNHERMSSITRVLHTATWDFFTSQLPLRFRRSPSVVKEAIMTDVNDLAQELMSSSDGSVGASFFAMRRVLEILEVFSTHVCFDIISVFFLRLSTLLIKFYRCSIPLLPSRSESDSNLRY